MALPDDSASSTVVAADYESPYDRDSGPLEDFEAGGIAISDGTEGLDVQIWSLVYDDDEGSPTYGDFTITGESTGEVYVPINVPEVVRVGLAFNQNMDPFIAYEDRDCNAKFYWYDTFIADYTTSTLPAGSKYVACCLDDHRITQTGTSDIIIAYIRSGALYYRQERDRFGVEYTLDADVGAGILYKVGMTKNLRLKFDVREGTGVRLSEIVAARCQDVGLPASRYEVGPLYPITVRGWKSAGLYTAADAIRGLQQTYFFDFVQIDGKLTAVRRGGEVEVTISQDDLVEGNEFRFEDAREQGVEFPLKHNLAYASAETDYTPTKATSERRSRDIRSKSESGVDSAVNHTAQDAAERCDIQHKTAWAEFEGKAKFSIPESYAERVVSNIISLEVRTGTYKRMRLVRMERVDGAYDCEAVIDRQSAYTAGAITLPTSVDPETPSPTIPGDTTWHFMDLPALLTAHDGLGPYVAGRGDASTAWHGARVQREVGADWETFADITSAENMGEVEEATGYGSRYVPDTTNTLLVSLVSAPSSTSNALLYKGKGAWLIGNEIIQVRDWVAEGLNWRGSYLLRGRLDTTPIAHSIGERVVFLGNPAWVSVDPSLLDTTLTLRAPSYGQQGADATSADYSFTGASAEEWAPIDLVANQSGSDWVLSWTPRYRLGSSANPIPSTHFYGWRIRFTVGSDMVTKTVNSITPEYTYSEADQITDFGSAQSSFDDVSIRGLNHLGGEGKELSEAVT